MLAPVSSVLALPNGEQLVAGSATVARPTAQSMTVNQSSSRAIVNWQGFSIAAPESVTFQQPDRSSVILNRVVGQDASQIAGRMQANGNVFLVNPNGVLFSKSAVVDVGGLVASTLDISNQDFLASRYHFGGRGGAVTNAGSLNAAEGGTIALLGGQVQNDGTITAQLGTVALAAGNRVSLDFAGDGLTKVTVTEGALAAAVHNRGAVIADGGQAILTARAADALTRSVVNHSGLVRAGTLVERGGKIVLDSGAEGTTEVTGTIDASGPDATATGGEIRALGTDVRLAGSARADASGGAGGGTVLIGGDYQGRNPEVRNAQSTTVGSEVTVSADALDKGNGGRVIAWSTGETKVHGTLSARGGPGGGDGGLIETSGASLDIDRARVSAGATAGRPGVWLLDPENIFITRTRAESISASLDSTNVVVSTSGDVQGDGDIGVGWTITKDGRNGSTTTLQLLAHRNVFLYDGSESGSTAIQSTGSAGPLNIEIVSGKTDRGGDISLPRVAQLRTNGGRLVLTGGSEGLQSLSAGPVRGAAVGQCVSNCSSAIAILAPGVSIFGATVDTRRAEAPAGDITVRGAGSLGGSSGIAIIDQSSITGRDVTLVGAGTGTRPGVAIHTSTISANEGNLVVDGRGETGTHIESGALLYRTGAPGGSIELRGSTSDGPVALKIDGQVGRQEDSANIFLVGTGTVSSSGRLFDVSGAAQAGRKIRTSGTIALRFEEWRGIRLDGSVLKHLSPGPGGVVVGSDAQTGIMTVVEPLDLPYSLTVQQGGQNAAGIFVDQPLRSSGTLALISGGPITQSAPVVAQNLLLSSGSGDLSFTNTGNNVQRVSISATGGNATFVNGGQSGTGGAGNGNGAAVNGATLTLGPVSARVSSASGSVSTTTLENSVSQGDFFLQNLSGDLTLAQWVRTLGSDITLVTPGVFNNAGNGQLSPGGSGRWSVWASTWVGENRGGLTPSSPRPNIYGCTYPGPCASGAAIPTTGNHFFYQERPTLTFTTPDQRRTYRDSAPLTFPVADVAGLQLGDTLSDALQGEFGTRAGLDSNVGSYPVTGNCTSPVGYRLPAPRANGDGNVFATVEITKATLTYAADRASREYGLDNPAFSGTVTGFRGNDTQANATTGTPLFTSAATRLAIPGSYPINGSGLDAANYTFVQAPGNATALTVTAEGTLFQANSGIPALDRTPGLRDTNVYSSGFLLPNMCLASEPIIGSSGLAAAGDILEIEWARVRLRPNLSNCVSVGDRDYCRDF